MVARPRHRHGLHSGEAAHVGIAGSKRARYGELADAAGKLPQPKSVKLKDHERKKNAPQHLQVLKQQLLLRERLGHCDTKEYQRIPLPVEV